MAAAAPLHGSRVPSPTSSSSGEGLTDGQKLQLVVRNCVQKAVELVLHSRVIPLPPHMRRGSTNRWFNLESEELLTVRDELEQWRQDMAQPLQLDIMLQTAGSSLMREAVGATAEEPSLVLLERWHLQYAPPPTPPGQIAWPGFYKRHMVLLRAIVGYLRLLPSHRLAHSLTKLRGDAPSLEYRLTVPSAPPPPIGPTPHSDAPPSLRGEFPPSLEHSPRSYSFTPPDGMHGKLLVSVLYRAEQYFRRREAPPPEARGHLCDGAGLGSAPQLGSHLIPDYVHAPSQPPQPTAHPSPPSTSRQAQCSPQLAAAAAGEARCSCSVEQREQVSQLTSGLMQLGAGGRYLGPASATSTPPRPAAAPSHSAAPRAASPVQAGVAVGAGTPSLHGGSCNIPCSPPIVCSPVLAILPPASHRPSSTLSLPFAAAYTPTEPGTATFAAATIASASTASASTAHLAPLPLQGGAHAGSPALGGSGGARGALAAAAAATPPSDAAAEARRPHGAGALPSPGPPTTPARSPLPTAASPRPSPPLLASGPASGLRTSHEHELPFQMEEEIEGDARMGGGGAGATSRQQQEQAELAQEVALGSFMMEVQAAPSLQLFRDCAASTSQRASGAASPSQLMSTSPLACSVEDISSQLDRLSRTFHEQSSQSSTTLCYAAAGRSSPPTPHSAHSAAGCGAAPPRGTSPLTLGGASTGGLGSVALPAPYGIAISPQRTSLRGDVSPARPASRGARSSNNTYSSQHTSPASSPYGSPMDGAMEHFHANLLGAAHHTPHMPHMPHMHGAMPPSAHCAALRQPLPVIAEPSYADVARYAESGMHPPHAAHQPAPTPLGQGSSPVGQGSSAEGSAPPRPPQRSPPSSCDASQLQPPQPRASESAQHAVAPRVAAGAAGAAGVPLVIAGAEGREEREGGEGAEGADSTERLLLSSSPPSESLFPFAPTPNT